MNNSEANIYARDKAIKYIGISKKTEIEVRKKLKRLNIASSVINDEIISLKELGFIDDNDYVSSYIKQCEKMLNYSIYEIRNKLLQKGVKASIIESSFESNLTSEYENLVVNKLINSKLKDYDEQKRREYLYRRGFKLDNIGEIYE